jgi:hypothetical protein
MKYQTGDVVEVRLGKHAIWVEGVVQEDTDPDHFIVILKQPELLSTLHGITFRRDTQVDRVKIKKHLEAMGLGYIHMRLKNTKGFKPK